VARAVAKPGAGGKFHQIRGCRAAGRQRFFTENVLPGPECSRCHRRMLGIRRADMHGIDRGIVEELPDIGRRCLHAKGGGQFRRRFGATRAHRGNIDETSPSDGFGMNPSHETGPDDGRAQSSFVFFRRWHGPSSTGKQRDQASRRKRHRKPVWNRGQ